MNLCANAVKFTTHGKALEEGPPRRNTVAVSCTLDDRSPSKSNHVLLRFSVRDTGIGMTQAGCESLFKPFQQLENGTTRRFGGTGKSSSRRLSREAVDACTHRAGTVDLQTTCHTDGWRHWGQFSHRRGLYLLVYHTGRALQSRRS
jgi:light-regulated signal transduction histidine kinase (bacteriophytochrome)